MSVLLSCPNIDADEAHLKSILQHIHETQQAIRATVAELPANDFVFLAFWDFDGTILKGDCSEGLTVDGNLVYKGLAQLAIEAGYSRIYRPEDHGLERFWEDYRHMEEHIGRWLAYPFLAQMLRGTQAEDVSSLANRQFRDVFNHHYFKSSINMLSALEEQGVENHIISASADIFVDAAAPTLGLPQDRFNGIEVRIEDGRLTEKLVYPVTWSDGKTEKLKTIVARIQSQYPTKQVFVLAAFGNSYSTDGSFMKFVASQTLPAGKPLAVMINGGEVPHEYQGLFTQVTQSEILGGANGPRRP